MTAKVWVFRLDGGFENCVRVFTTRGAAVDAGVVYVQEWIDNVGLQDETAAEIQQLITNGDRFEAIEAWRDLGDSNIEITEHDVEGSDVTESVEADDAARQARTIACTIADVDPLCVRCGHRSHRHYNNATARTSRTSPAITSASGT